MVQGCIMWLPSSTCETAFHGGDVNDPYFMFDRAQQIRYRNGTWGRGDNYTGPWQWAFYYDSRALRTTTSSKAASAMKRFARPSAGMR